MDDGGERLRPLLGPKKYCMGVPHGDDIKVQFPDGSTYRGAFRDGRITGGRGVYTDMSGARFEGPFLDGTLHGENGSVSHKDERSFSGRWQRGQLDGHGTYKSKRCVREGRWLNGRMHGMGFESRERFRYNGMWKNDRRHGIGTMMFDASPVVKSAKIRRGDALDGRTYHEKKYAHLYVVFENIYFNHPTFLTSPLEQQVRLYLERRSCGAVRFENAHITSKT